MKRKPITRWLSALIALIFCAGILLQPMQAIHAEDALANIEVEEIEIVEDEEIENIDSEDDKDVDDEEGEDVDSQDDENVGSEEDENVDSQEDEDADSEEDEDADSEDDEDVDSQDDEDADSQDDENVDSQEDEDVDSEEDEDADSEEDEDADSQDDDDDIPPASNSVLLISDDENDGYGSYNITLPDDTDTTDGITETYTVAFAIYREAYGDDANNTLSYSASEYYTVTVTDADGNTTATYEDQQFAAQWSETYSASTLSYTITVDAGSTIEIANILTKTLIEASHDGYEYGSYDETYMGVIVTPSSSCDWLGEVSFDIDNPTLLATDSSTTAQTATVAQAETTKGSYELVLPDGSTDTYEVSFYISHYGANSGNILTLTNTETYKVLITAADGTTTSSEWHLFRIDTEDPTQLYLTLTGVAAGSIITIQDVETEYIIGYANGYYTQGSYIGTDVSVTITQEDSVVQTVAYSEDAVEISAGNTVGITATLGAVQTEPEREVTYDFTDATVNDGGGEYSILYMLNNYNVVSLDNIESTHIVGPILAVDIAQRTQGTVSVDYGDGVLNTTTVSLSEEGSSSSVLVASDYANGISSYVGTLVPVSGTDDTSAFVLNYGMETLLDANFTAPYFYSSTVGVSTDYDQGIIEAIINSETVDYIYLSSTDNSGNTSTEATYISPNASGKTETYLNAEFIDVDELTSAMTDGSADILANGTAEDDTFIDYSARYYYFELVDESTGVSTAYVYYGATATASTTATTNSVTSYWVDGMTYDFSNSTLLASGTANRITLTDAAGGTPYLSTNDYNTDGFTLTIDVGTSWMILSAENLEVVDITYPDNYDYFTNPYPIATTINFACDTINPIEYTIDLDGDGDAESVSHSQLPTMLVNGAQVDTADGENGEYGEGGKKIVWNMPNLVTDSATGDNRLVTYGDGDNILGHIIAPNAEFWNYTQNADGSLDWEGGNINGGVIVKSFYSGEAEMHMWPYDGANEYHVSYALSISKAVNDAGPLAEFSFILYPDDATAANSGLANNTFPLTVSNEVNATEARVATFSDLVFIEEGDYTFIIQESIPDVTNSDGIVYDLSEYQVTITVTTNDDGDLAVSSVTQTKIVDTDGTAIDEDAQSTTITVTDADGVETTVYKDDTYNAGEEYAVYFNNTNPSEDELSLVTVTFIKWCEVGEHTLAGAVFSVQEMTSATDFTRPTGGYYSEVTSGADGSVVIEELSRSTYYVLYETEAPAGHQKADGYWVFYVDELGRVTTYAYGDAPDIIDDIYIVNEPDESSSLALTKANQYDTPLAGVSFSVQHVVLEYGGVPAVVVDSYADDFITDADGTFTIDIEDLTSGYVYMITETEGLDGYVAHTGYWLIETTSDALHPSTTLSYTITEYDADHNVVSTVTNDTLYNTKIEFMLPETGGIGTQAPTAIGTALMLLGMLAYTLRKKQLWPSPRRCTLPCNATAPPHGNDARHNDDPPTTERNLS